MTYGDKREIPVPVHIYKAWYGMNLRCGHMPSVKSKPKWDAAYKDRGIIVSEEFRFPNGLRAFYEHVGDKPTFNHLIDRIDNNGPYARGNLRWSTMSVSNNNQRRG
jgi:hypothetical protein